MPDMKEKLVELLTDCEAKGYWSYGTDSKTGEHGGHEMTAEDIADYLVENIVDAVEVVHGWWIHQEEDIRGISDHQYVCSVCGHLYWNARIPNFKYCPNCGAKMDGGNEDV